MYSTLVFETPVTRFAWILLILMTATSVSSAQVDFAREVLPILSENCFHCHGPEAKSRKAGLRLDTKEGAYRTRKEITSIVPGKSSDSEVIRRVLAHDDEQMPPADSNRKLTARQKDTLKKWVDEGAKWATHWAYEPLPKVVNVPNTAKSPIDAFVVDRLRSAGLAAAGDSTKSTWLRRVTFDLTGLPPTLQEAVDFEADRGDSAYEKVVDRLLASPRYGERMATEWLDLARFGDTLGYQHDRHQPMWPFRDWVIKSFNANQRFDRFLTEQLAGDLLPNATKDQRLATAFNRLHMQNEEGGIVEEEFRVAYVADRVNTMGTAFLGQTFECCRCHDHKFDPLTQKDYYSLFAFFQNIPESGQTSYFTSAMNTPTLLLSTPEQDAKIKELTAKVAETQANLSTVRTLSDTAFEDWRSNRNREYHHGKHDVAIYRFNDLSGTKVPNLVKNQPDGKTHDRIEEKNGGIILNGENGVEFPGVGHYHRYDQFSIIIEIRAESFAPRAVVLHHAKAPVDAGSRGYELLLEQGRVSFGLHHMWPGNSLKVLTKNAIQLNQKVQIGVTYDGSSRATGLKIYIDGEPAELEVIRDNLRKDIAYESGEPNLTIGYRFRDSGFKNGWIGRLQISNRVLVHAEINSNDIRKMDLYKNGGTKDYFLAAVDKASLEKTAALREARKELAKFVEPIPEIMVMDELPQPKPAFVLKRGAYDSPGDKVVAETPKSLPPFDGLPRNRLGLAQWLTRPDHPLTARVTVNRLWQQMFGRGLVETSDNFGTTGTPPSHPELLDWLARDFVDHGWDVKRTLKMIALSSTYRQSSRTTPEVRAKDPSNDLLARYAVRRLTAEMLRDQALFASGLLKEKLGGPSVYPVQPAGLWNDAMGKPKYPQSKGDDLHRRSLYTHWKRTAPPPQMLTFDAADRQNCSARRQSTSTPLQALVLLNDPQMVEAARFLAERMLAEKDPFEFGCRTVLGRSPSDAEKKVLIALLVQQELIFFEDKNAAEKLLSVGEKKRNEKLNAVSHAAMTQLALTLLNHDEAVNRR